MQGRPPGWVGDGVNPQWNPGAIGKPPQKLVNQNPAQYGGVDELNWNLPKVSLLLCWHSLEVLCDFSMDCKFSSSVFLV